MDAKNEAPTLHSRSRYEKLERVLEMNFKESELRISIQSVGDVDSNRQESGL